MRIGTPTLDNPYERPDFVDEGFDYCINVFGEQIDGTYYHCPCCGLPTLTMRGSFETCAICYWEDDGQDSHDADRIRGGPNGELSLTLAREKFAHFGACELRFVNYVRKATAMETKHRVIYDI